MRPASASPSRLDQAGDVAFVLSAAFLGKCSGDPIAFRVYDARMRAFISAIALSALMVVTAHDADRPNIVFIMTDDHAAHAIGAYGSRVNETPNLDRLAREGALLTNVFATNSICTPSRAAILTGQYSHVNGVTMFNRFDSSRMTVARLLQAGRLLHRDDRQVAPRQRSRRLRSMGDPARARASTWIPCSTRPTDEKTYTGRVRHRRDHRSGAIDFLEKRPRNKPFFLMMHHKAPHRPWEPDAAHARAVRGPVDSGAGNVLGLVRHAHGRAARKPAARRGGPDQPRPQAAAARRARRAPS